MGYSRRTHIFNGLPLFVFVRSKLLTFFTFFKRLHRNLATMAAFLSDKRETVSCCFSMYKWLTFLYDKNVNPAANLYKSYGRFQLKESYKIQLVA